MLSLVLCRSKSTDWARRISMKRTHEGCDQATARLFQHSRRMMLPDYSPCPLVDMVVVPEGIISLGCFAMAPSENSHPINPLRIIGAKARQL